MSLVRWLWYMWWSRWDCRERVGGWVGEFVCLYVCSRKVEEEKAV